MMREISFRAGALTTWSVEAENHTNARDSFKLKTQDSMEMPASQGHCREGRCRDSSASPT